MNRRGFLAGILALGVAPAIVRAHSLMPVRVYDGPCLWVVDQMPQMIANAHASYRWVARHGLEEWFADELDQLVYARLAA